MDIIDLDSDPNIVSGSNLNLVVIMAPGSNTATQIGMPLMPCEEFKACFLDCCRMF